MKTCTSCHKRKQITHSSKSRVQLYSGLVAQPELYNMELCKSCHTTLFKFLVDLLSDGHYNSFVIRHSKKCKS